MSDALKEDILQDYVNKLCKHSRIASDAVKIYLSDTEKLGRPKRELDIIKYAEVLLEFITFFLHFTDRCLFWEGVAEGGMDVEQRDDLMDYLVERCIGSAVDYCFFGLEEQAKREYKKSSFNVYNSRMEQYSKYKKDFAEKGEGYKGTLFWEFGKNIEELVGRGHDIGLKMMCIRVSVEAIKELDPKSFFGMIKG